MNEALKIENINKFFDEIGKPVSTNFVYGYEDPKNSSFLLLGSLSVIDQKYYIAAFFENEIVLALLTRTGKFQGNYISIPQNQIKDIRVKKGLIQYKVIIDIDNQKHILKCNKFIFNMPWQKENIQHLENNAWYIK